MTRFFCDWCGVERDAHLLYRYEVWRPTEKIAGAMTFTEWLCHACMERLDDFVSKQRSV